MNRLKNFISFGLVACLSLVISCQSSTDKSGNRLDRPNIILVLTDDQGWGDLSINGNTDINTPNIDQLAVDGAQFERFYVSPVCSPTRAELLTGRYHVRGGVYSTSRGGERLDLDETTIAEVFKENGYKTAAYGKWHNGMQYPYHPNGRGFEDFYGFCSGHWGNYYNPVLEHNGELVKGNGFIIDDLTNKAMSFMEENVNQPFFLYLPLNTPHSPMQVPDEYWDRFKNKDLSLENRFAEKENLKHTLAALAMCENIDWNVGRLMNKLRELQLEENTIVIYLSDNGPNGYRWNDGMKGVKGSTDEGGVRSPFIIQWKGKIAPEQKIPEIAGAIDLLPTLADLANIRAHTNKPLDGISLKPLLLDNNADWQDRLIFSYWNTRTSVRSQEFRLDNEDKLFNMVTDPGQRENVADEFPDVYTMLSEAKERWQAEVLSELPENDLRAFPVGHPDYEFTQIPARDGTAHGSIERSNRWPNCSFFTNWTQVEDSITWDVEVMATGDYEVVLYYTCNEENIGSSIQLSFNNDILQRKIIMPHDPPLVGAEYDRVIRQESYVKDFAPLNMGIMRLNKGTGQLTLKALKKAGEEVMDFRLIMLKRVES